MEEQPQFNDVLLYATAQGKVKIEVTYEDETFWLNQKRMGELFGVARSTIAEHLQNIFQTSELDENSVWRKFRHTAADGKNHETQFYNLEAVIAIGYCVNSVQATRFRIWSTNTLKEFIVKGFENRKRQGANLAFSIFRTPQYFYHFQAKSALIQRHWHIQQ